jgi:hypothetical protein
MKKHAYLIMAHNNFYILEKLLCLIDDERNDIYIHIDKKIENFKFEYFKGLVKKSRILYVNRLNIHWGGFSVIKCQMVLLKHALANRYEYYHLLSGVDLPLKTQNYIHTYFDVQAGKEFIGFAQEPGARDYRVKYIHLFNEEIGRSTNFMSILKRTISEGFVFLQRLAKYDRTKKFGYDIKRGSNWCSISHALAEFLVDNDETITNLFKYSVIGDEVVFQTLAFNSRFRQRIYDPNDEFAGCMRYIDWNRGTPYTFRKRDYEELIHSDRLFARKFDEQVDKDIVHMICEYVNNRVCLESIDDSTSKEFVEQKSPFIEEI